MLRALVNPYLVSNEMTPSLPCVFVGQQPGRFQQGAVSLAAAPLSPHRSGCFRREVKNPAMRMGKATIERVTGHIAGLWRVPLHVPALFPLRPLASYLLAARPLRCGDDGESAGETMPYLYWKRLLAVASL